MSRPTAAPRKAARGEYIETDTGNKVSRRARIEGTAHITLGGRTVIQAEACLRGDLHRFSTSQPSTSSTNNAASTSDKPTSSNLPSTTSIIIGRYTVLSTGCLLTPPHRISRGQFTYYPMKLGDHVFVGPNAVVQSASIGSHVYIGANTVLGNGSIIKDYVKVLEHTYVPEGMVVPSNYIVGGRPGRIVGEVGDGWGQGAAGEEGWVEGGELRELVRSIR